MRFYIKILYKYKKEGAFHAAIFCCYCTIVGGMALKEMKFKLDFERCKGCTLCIAACPKNILEMQSERLNKSGYYTVSIKDDDACIECAICATMCPDCAIEIG